MQQPRDQRVGVFVDVQNLYYSAKHLYSSKLNFKEILKQAVGDRKLIRAIAYAVKAQMPEEEYFFKALGEIGYEVKLKELQIYGTFKKADWDVGLAIDAIELGHKLDTVVLISGDGDYVPMVEHLKRAIGCRVEVMAFGKSTNRKLIEVADSFFDLDSSSKFLIKGSKR